MSLYGDGAHRNDWLTRKALLSACFSRTTHTRVRSHGRNHDK